MSTSETTHGAGYGRHHRTGVFRRIGRFFKWTVVVLALIVALSYLPGYLFENAPRLEQTHRITLEVRELIYGLLDDAADGIQVLYRDYGDRLPQQVDETLEPWLAPEPTDAPDEETIPTPPNDELPTPSSIQPADPSQSAPSQSATDGTGLDGTGLDGTESEPAIDTIE